MSQTSHPALLMVAMEPPAALEDEFNDWYDTEHFPQRRGLPGFLSASRWVCLDGWPRWLAVYDLASLDALQSDAYMAVSGPRSTPWSRRILPRTVGRTRVLAQALAPSQAAVQHDALATTRLLAMSVRCRVSGPLAHDVAAHVIDTLSERDDLLQLRAFVERSDAGDVLWMLAAFDSPVIAAALAGQVGRPAGYGIATFNLYQPYQRSGY